jgi:hypothetical protein
MGSLSIPSSPRASVDRIRLGAAAKIATLNFLFLFLFLFPVCNLIGPRYLE